MGPIQAPGARSWRRRCGPNKNEHNKPQHSTDKVMHSHPDGCRYLKLCRQLEVVRDFKPDLRSGLH
jgi:hypothetical protein